MMASLLAIALGGAAGSLLRHALNSWATSLWGAGFPYGILLVNLLGSFLAGFAFALLAGPRPASAFWQPLVMVGFLGGFTTFSAFSLQALALLQEGRWLACCAYAGGSLLLGVAGAALGLALGQRALAP